jgi:hypothetical protein
MKLLPGNCFKMREAQFSGAKFERSAKTFIPKQVGLVVNWQLFSEMLLCRPKFELLYQWIFQNLEIQNGD